MTCRQLTKPAEQVSRSYIMDVVYALKNREFDQSAIVDATICNPLAKLYSPSTGYIKLFLKRLIAQLEENEIEVVDDIYNAYIDIVSAVEVEESFHYRTYKVNQDLRIILKETRSLVIDGTTGLTTWAASHVFVEYILKHTSSFKSKRILELGSGLGLTGLALIRTCSPKSYTFTDHHPKVLEYLLHNVDLNLGSSGTEINGNNENHAYQWQGSDVYINSLDWESPGQLQQYDFIIGADIIFDPALVPMIVSVLLNGLISDGRAVIASTLRNEKTFDDFMKQAAKDGLKVEQVEEKSYQESKSQPEELVKIVTFSRLKKSCCS